MSAQDLDKYICNLESHNHDQGGLPPFRSALHAAGPVTDEREEVYVRLGLRPGHWFATKQMLVYVKQDRVVALRKRWIWRWDV